MMTCGDTLFEQREVIGRIEMPIDAGPEVLPRLVAGLRAALGDDLRSVVLFGSRARGDHHADSDWDLLVIAERLPERTLERYRTLKSALPPDSRGATAILAVTPPEFEARVSEVYLDIALDGQVLYDRDNYASEKLAQLRHTIVKVGLYRERTAAGDTWDWRDPPRNGWSIEWERQTVASIEDSRYRLQLAAGFLDEAREDAQLRRWRSCVDNSQLAVENASKAVLALLGPVGRTHATANSLRQALERGRFAPAAIPGASRLVELAEQLGWDVHVASDYGDETERRAPWELFDDVAARGALDVAGEAFAVGRQIVEDELGR